jgi:AcrR family transcriptional regulator
VDDIVRRAQTSHGTFYLYFSNKEDLFKALLRDALHDMGTITDGFPVVTRNEAGRAALRTWVGSFCDTYESHAAVIRALSQAELVGEDIWGDGLQLLFRLSEAMAQGMTAAARRGAAARPAAADSKPGGDSKQGADSKPGGDGKQGAGESGSTGEAGPERGDGHAELTALACLMMLERVNYLLSVEVRLPREDMVDRIAAIMYAAFDSA